MFLKVMVKKHQALGFSLGWDVKLVKIIKNQPKMPKSKF
jgi:hypothetical protein